MKPAKGPATWLIIVGYTIVALTITFNYISKQSETRAQRLIGGGAEEAPVRSTAEADALRRQLEEQRQVNREMAQMIERMQTTLSGVQLQDLPRAGMPTTSANEAEVADVKVRSVQQDWETTEAAKLPPNKNSFLSFYAGGPNSGLPQASHRRERFALRLDPLVPVVFRGGDTSVQVRQGP